jgi:hypothetical protein
MATLNTPAQINWFQMRTQLGALKLEIKGLRHSSGRSVYAHIKRTYGLKGNKQRVYDQFKELVDAQKQETER